MRPFRLPLCPPAPTAFCTPVRAHTYSISSEVATRSQRNGRRAFAPQLYGSARAVKVRLAPVAPRGPPLTALASVANGRRLRVTLALSSPALDCPLFARTAVVPARYSLTQFPEATYPAGHACGQSTIQFAGCRAIFPRAPLRWRLLLGRIKAVAGQWIGKGAGGSPDRSGDTHHEEFVRLCENLHPQTGQRLTARHKTTRREVEVDGTEHRSANRRVFYDFTFSPPKSVSIAALIGGDSRIIEERTSRR